MVGMFAFAHDVRGYLGYKVMVKIVAVHGKVAWCRTADRTDKCRSIAVPVGRLKVELDTQVMSEVEAQVVKSRQLVRKTERVA